jgi:hypothetical protein
VPVARRIGLEIDVCRASRKRAIFPGHRPPFDVCWVWCLLSLRFGFYAL